MTGESPTEDMSSDLVSVTCNSDPPGQPGMDEPAKPAPVPTPDLKQGLLYGATNFLRFELLKNCPHSHQRGRVGGEKGGLFSQGRESPPVKLTHPSLLQLKITSLQTTPNQRKTGKED